MTPDRPMMAPQRLGITIQLSCRWGRIEARRPRAPASMTISAAPGSPQDLQPFRQIQDARSQSF